MNSVNKHKVALGLVLSFLAGLLLSTPPAYPKEDVGYRWQQALLSGKKTARKPGQQCLYSKPLKRCLWYTPSKWNDWSTVKWPPLRTARKGRVQPRGWTTLEAGWGMYGAGFFGLPL